MKIETAKQIDNIVNITEVQHLLSYLYNNHLDYCLQLEQEINSYMFNDCINHLEELDITKE